MPPEVVTTVAEVRARIAAARREGRRIGFVPTMGALHAGHASLIRRAAAEGNYVVVSIFVNPTQFGPKEDFSRYPRTFDADIALCNRENADLVFAPAAEEIYPPGPPTFVEVAGLQDVLCGKSRPGHFRGVATVVLKLFNIVQPDFAYFGQKDAQQAVLIQRMASDLHLPISIRVCPIVREPDGLALSSRNRYLTPTERSQATVLFRALELGRGLAASGERRTEPIRAAMVRLIESAPAARIDYVEIVDPRALAPVAVIEDAALAAMAVHIGDTRLIDNMLFTVPQLANEFGKSSTQAY